MATDMRWWTRFASEVRAAAHGDAPTSSPIRLARDGLGFDCAALVGGATNRSTPHRVLANIDYPVSVMTYIATTYARTCPAHAFVVEHPAAMRFIDLPFDVRDTRTYQEALGPNGFREGITLPLNAGRGRDRPGFIAMSSTCRRPLDDDARLALTMLASELSGLLDPGATIAGRPATIVARVVGADVTLRVGSIEEGPFTGTQLCRIARLSNAGRVAFRHRGDDGRWWLVEVSDRAGAALIRISDSVVPGGLTARELDVVGLVSRGWSNDQIADALGISIRTARSHVEASLGKLGASNRTALARIAFDENLDSADALKCAAADIDG